MRTLLTFGIALALAGSALAQPLAEFTFENSLPVGTTTYTQVLPGTAQVVGALAGGIQPAPSTADRSLVGFGFPTAGTGYFEFGLLCPSGQCDLTGIDAVIYAAAGAPTSVRVAYSTQNGFANPVTVGTFPLNPGSSTSLSLTPVALGVTRVAVRVYAFGATDPLLGTLYLGGASINGSILAPLPAALVDISAERTRDNEVTLSWTTASESNVEAFVVEVAYGRDEEFAGVVKVGPRGANGGGAQYTAVVPARARTLYLRVRTLDFDGTSAVSEVVSVGPPSGKTSWAVAVDRLQLQLTSDEPGDYRLVSLGGETVARGHVRAGEPERIGLEGLPTGFYVVHLNGESRRVVAWR